MEEKKLKASVKEGKEKKAAVDQKLTYEQLNNVCNQLFQQNQQLRKKLEETGSALSLKRLDYLFKVIENVSVFGDGDFINSCVDEIKEALTPQVTAEDKGTDNGGEQTEEASKA